MADTPKTPAPKSSHPKTLTSKAPAGRSGKRTAPKTNFSPSVESAAESAVKSIVEPASRADLPPRTEQRIAAPGESLRRAVAESATVTTRGALEVNSKLLEAFRAQSDVTLNVWRSVAACSSLSEAMRLQAVGARQAYETAAEHWKDIAETAGLWFNRSVEPIRSAWSEGHH